MRPETREILRRLNTTYDRDLLKRLLKLTIRGLETLYLKGGKAVLGSLLSKMKEKVSKKTVKEEILDNIKETCYKGKKKKMYSVSTDENKCEFCGEKFKTKEELNAHEKTCK